MPVIPSVVTQTALNGRDRWIEIVVHPRPIQDIDHVTKVENRKLPITMPVVIELMTENEPRGPEVGRRYREAVVVA